MSRGIPSGALRDIGTLFSDGGHGGLTDTELLERFVNRNGTSAEDAFTTLLERHGPMVWCVCRRLLSDPHAAADAFQATFLVLVRRASVVKVDGSLGPWLYGVSRRVAARARATSLRRRARETGEIEAVAGPAPDPDHVERLAILDAEIGRLPERQRAAVVLCDLASSNSRAIAGAPFENGLDSILLTQYALCPTDETERNPCEASSNKRGRVESQTGPRASPIKAGIRLEPNTRTANQGIRLVSDCPATLVVMEAHSLPDHSLDRIDLASHRGTGRSPEPGRSVPRPCRDDSPIGVKGQ